MEENWLIKWLKNSEQINLHTPQLGFLTPAQKVDSAFMEKQDKNGGQNEGQKIIKSVANKVVKSFLKTCPKIAFVYPILRFRESRKFSIFLF